MDFENVDLEANGFEEGTRKEQIHSYNKFTILSTLEFPREEATNPESKSTKYLDELVQKDLSNEDIVAKLIEYRKIDVNYRDCRLFCCYRLI